MSEALELLKQLISTPSLSRDEGKVADLLESYLRSKGFFPQRYLQNVWVKNFDFDPRKPTLLLNSHLDTVKPNSGYTRDPFTPVVSEGKLFGLGSTDAGGCLVSLLTAFIHYARRPDLAYNLVFAATAEEEISGENGIEALLSRPEAGFDPVVDCAIVGEPTSLQMAVAEKGLLVLDCSVVGRSGHAAREEGINAIEKALADLQWFKDYRFEKTSSFLGRNKMSVTQIQAGSQHNVVPRECNFTVDVRINELYDFENVLATIRNHVQCEVKPRSLRMKSTSISLEHPLVLAGLALGRVSYGSPTTSDKALMPFPALKIGPGESSRSHTADEYIELREIDEGIELYLKLLAKVILK